MGKTTVFTTPPAQPTEVPVTSLVSTQGHVNGEDIKGLLITAGLFALGGFITSLLQNVNLLHLGDTGTLIVTLLLGMIGKFVQKLIDGPKAV